MDAGNQDWIRVCLRETDDSYDGELLARLESCLVVNVIGDEHTFAGTHVFPSHAISSEEPAPVARLLAANTSIHGALPTPFAGDSLNAILQGRPLDRLLLLEQIGDSEVCWIGFPTVDGDEVVLREVDANGELRNRERYRIDGLARIAWGGGYLSALEDVLRPGTRAVDAFAGTVRCFVDVITTGANLGAVERVLAELQAGVLHLPDWTSDGGEGESRPQPEGLPELLYWDVFEPCVDVPEDPVASSLTDNLYDIWIDLTEGLSLFDAGDRGGACEHWKFTHQSHWGRHLVGALRALHLAGR